MFRGTLIPGPRYDHMTFGVVVPRAFAASIKRDMERLNVPRPDVLSQVINLQIEAVEFERTDFNPHTEPGNKTGAQVVLRLPIPLMRRVECRRNVLAWDCKCSGSLSYVVRRCLALHYPLDVPAYLQE